MPFAFLGRFLGFLIAAFSSLAWLAYVAACERGTEVTAPHAAGRGVATLNNEAPRTHMPLDRIVEALTNPEETNGLLLVGLKEAGTLKGVTDDGIELPLAARFVAEATIREAFPELAVVRGVSRPLRVADSEGFRTDTLHVTFLTVRPPIEIGFLERLRRHPNVDYIEPNWSNAVLYSDGDAIVAGFSPALSVQAQHWGITAVRADTVWQEGYTGSGIGVGVADTGADIPFGNIHPDLDFSSGWLFGQFVQQRSNNTCGTASVGQPCWYEKPHHGTGVLGALMAADNGVGSIGVAPGGSNDYAMIAKIAYTRSGDTLALEMDDFAAGVKWINQNWDSVAHPIRVAVTSVGWRSVDTTQYNTLRLAFSYRVADDAVLWFAAAGNNGDPFISIPARFGRVVAVGAVDSAINRTWWSATGPQLELMAPGSGFRGPYLLES